MDNCTRISPWDIYRLIASQEEATEFIHTLSGVMTFDLVITVWSTSNILMKIVYFEIYTVTILVLTLNTLFIISVEKWQSTFSYWRGTCVFHLYATLYSSLLPLQYSSNKISQLYFLHHYSDDIGLVILQVILHVSSPFLHFYKLPKNIKDQWIFLHIHQLQC